MTRVLTILVTLLLASTASAAGLTISLHKEVYAGGRLILVSEIAVLTGDVELAKKAGAVTVGTTPTTMGAASIGKATVLKRLMLNGISEDQVEFKGEALVLVYSATTWGVAAGVKTEAAVAAKTADPAPAVATANASDAPKATDAPVPAPAQPAPARKNFMDAVYEDIRTLTATTLGLDIADITVKPEEVGPKLRVLDKEVAQYLGCFDPSPVGGPLGRRSYKVNAVLNGVNQDGLQVVVTISRLVTVAVATRRLGAGTLISSTDMKLEKRAFTTEVSDYFTDLESVEGMEPNKQTIEEGREIRRSAVKAGVLVKRGEVVECKAILGRLTVTFKGKVLEDGVKGQAIRVEREVPAEGPNARPGKVQVLVRVTSKGLCQIDTGK